MRPARLALIVILLSSGTRGVPARAEEANEWERPFTAALPLPDEDLSVNPPEDVAPPRRRAAWLLDAVTRRPVPGAVLWCQAERCGERTVDYATRHAEVVADPDGLAVLDVGPEGVGWHWVAEAPGYAPTHVSPLYRPEPEMLLRRGTRSTVRTVDGLGRPIADAGFDLFPGCPCGPTVTAGRTGPDGRFTFGPWRPGRWWYDLRASTAALDQVGTATTLGRRPLNFVLDPRWDVEGRVVDAAGRPVAGAAVRPDDWPRAPRALTDSEGRFRLPGSPPGAPLLVTPPGHEEPVGSVREYGRQAFTIRLDADGCAVRAPDAEAHVTLRVAPDVEVRLTHESGWSTTLWTDADGDDRPGFVEADLPAGDYVVEPASPFEPVEFPPQRREASAGSQSAWEIDATVPAPRLTIRGDVPGHATVRLSVGADARWLPAGCAPGSWHPHLPADAPAALAVQPAGHHGVWFFFAVGAVTDGARVVDVAVPPPHRARVAGAWRSGGDLLCDGVEVTTVEGDACLETYATGPMMLVHPGRWRTADEEHAPNRVFRFELPETPSAEPLDLAWDEGKVAGRDRVRARIVLPDGVDPDDVSYRVECEEITVHGGDPDGVLAGPPPCRIVVTLPGYQPFDRTFTEPIDTEVRWGTAALHLDVRDATGAATPSIVAVDGLRHWTAGGSLQIAGLAAGPHDVIVCPADDGLEGRSLRLVLGEGETRARTVSVRSRR